MSADSGISITTPWVFKRLGRATLIVFALVLSLIHSPAAWSCDPPRTFLWAWQHAENVSFLDPNKFGIAFLACHVFLTGDSVLCGWRDQPLKLPHNPKLIAVVRVDVDPKVKASLHDTQCDLLVAALVRAAHLPGIEELQIDFDATLNQREFYRTLLRKTRAAMPAKLPLSITCLASWCLFDSWMDNLPVDETVPMMFSLGPERQKVILYFKGQRDFRVPSCCAALGISIDDLEMSRLMIARVKQRRIPVRIFVYSRTAWTKEKVAAVERLLGEQ